jgi:hypothetical protein
MITYPGASLAFFLKGQCAPGKMLHNIFLGDYFTEILSIV